LIECIFGGRILTLYRFIIDFIFQKFRTKKLRTIISFDRELGLRRFKNKSCSKWRSEVREKSQKGIRNPKFFQNFIVYYLFFVSLVYLTFFSISSIMSKNFENFCGVSLYGLENLSKNFGKL